jgi:pimeloyl-ACP methyl ester carboxylesterase
MGHSEFTRSLVDLGDVQIETFEHGKGPAVLFLPSLARSAEDYVEVASLVAAQGFCSLRLQPRGIGASKGPMTGVTLHDLASDVAGVIRKKVGAPAVIAGHAFGNFVARMTAADHPDVVRAVVVIAGTSGLVEIDPTANESVFKSSDMSLPDEERLVHLRRAFFAPGNDASIWLKGWHPDVKAMQHEALKSVPKDAWTGAGGKPVLNLQCADDTIAPSRHAHTLREKYGDRIVTKMVANAGHAAVDEQPHAIAEFIVDYLKKL